MFNLSNLFSQEKGLVDYGSFYTFQEGMKSPFLLTAEHAGNLWPDDVEIFGMPDNWQDRHYAYDPGVREFTIELAKALKCPAILGKFSRVLVDLNRIPGAEDIIKESNDGVDFPMNKDMKLSPEKRINEYYVPYHQKIRQNLDLSTKHIAIHSYPEKRSTDAEASPWHLGIQYPVRNKLITYILDNLHGIDGKVVADNMPYDLRLGLPGSISLQSAAFGIDTVELEFRDDQLTDPECLKFWLAKLTGCLETYDRFSNPSYNTVPFGPMV